MYFRYSLNMHSLCEIKLKHFRYDSKQRKHQMREVNMKQQKNKEEKLINLNYFYSCYDDWFFDSCPVEVRSTIPVLYDLHKFSHTLYGYFYTGPVCFYQKTCKPCQ